MVTFRKWPGTAALAALAGVVLVEAASAQPIYVPPTARLQLNPVNRMAASLAMNQWAYNASNIGRNYNALVNGVAINPFAPVNANPAATLFSTYNQALLNSSLPYFPAQPYIPPINYAPPVLPAPVYGATAPPIATTPGAPAQAVMTSSTSPYGTSGSSSGPTITSVPITPAYTSPYGYGGYGYPFYDPLSGFLQGQASVYNAQGQYQVQYQQSQLTRQQVKQAAIETRRRAFDEWQYERANTPTLQDLREQSQKLQERHAMTSPPSTEVWSGDSLNTLLKSIQKKRVPTGYDIALGPEVVKGINLSTGSSAGGIGAVRNLPKDPSGWNWPLVLTDAEFEKDRETIQQVMPELVKSASEGKVNASQLQQVRGSMNRLVSKLDEKVNDLPPSDFIAARRYLKQLSDAVQVFQSDDASKYFTSLDGIRSVRDLVKLMTDRGLIFAPAAGGDEASYNALQQALSAYAAAAERAGSSAP